MSQDFRNGRRVGGECVICFDLKHTLNYVFFLESFNISSRSEVRDKYFQTEKSAYLQLLPPPGRRDVKKYKGI